MKTFLKQKLKTHMKLLCFLKYNTFFIGQILNMNIYSFEVLEV